MQSKASQKLGSLKPPPQKKEWQVMYKSHITKTPPALPFTLQLPSGDEIGVQRSDFDIVSPLQDETATGSIGDQAKIKGAGQHAGVVARITKIPYYANIASYHEFNFFGEHYDGITDLGDNSFAKLTMPLYLSKLPGIPQPAVHGLRVDESSDFIALDVQKCSSDLNKRFRWDNESLIRSMNADQLKAVKMHTTRGMLRCITKLHDNGICHRDPHPANFASIGNDVKLFDYGCAMFFTKESFFDQVVGDPHYTAPEVSRAKKGEKYRGPPADVFTLGVGILYVWIGFLLWDDTSADTLNRYRHFAAACAYGEEFAMTTLRRNIAEAAGDRADYCCDVPDKVLCNVVSMIHPDASTRPTAGEVLARL